MRADGRACGDKKMEPDKIETMLDEGRPLAAVKILKKYKGTDAKTLFLYAEALRLSGFFEPSLKACKAALSNCKDKTLKIEILLSLAKNLRTLGRAKEASETALCALKLCGGSAAFWDLKMQAVLEQALALRAQGRLDESSCLLKRVMVYYKEIKDIAGQSFVYWSLGGICRLKGDFKAGVIYFKEAARLSGVCGDDLSVAYAYCGLAGISRIAGDIKACVKNYELAEKIFKLSQDIFGKAYTNCGMANGLRQLGKYDIALKRYAVADKLYTSINDNVDLGFVKWGKADILKRQNKLKEALLELTAAKKLFANSDEIRGQLLTEISLAQLLYVLGKKAQAQKIYFAAVARAKKEGLFTYLESLT